MASAAGSMPAPVAVAARRQQRATSALHLSHGGPAANASPLRCLFMLALLCVLAPNARGANPTATHIIPMFVSSVSPAEGSIFGGSRLFVNGSGFETNHHVGGNVVKVGRTVSFRNVPHTRCPTLPYTPSLPLHNCRSTTNFLDLPCARGTPWHVQCPPARSRLYKADSQGWARLCLPHSESKGQKAAFLWSWGREGQGNTRRDVSHLSPLSPHSHPIPH